MSAYQAKRAEQKARASLKTAGAMKLHRIVDLEIDDYCAQEGCYMTHPMGENQGDGPLPKVIKPSKAERTEVANIWRVAFWFGFTVGAFLLLVHWGVSK